MSISIARIEATNFDDAVSIVELLEEGFASHPDRLAHMLMVATKVRETLAKLAENQLLASKQVEPGYRAALVHDMGYLPPLVKYDFHPLDAWVFLHQQGQPELAEWIVAHSNSPEQAALRGLPVEHGARDTVANVITYWDVRVLQGGKVVTYDERLEDIALRYEPSHPTRRAHQKARQRIERIIASVDALLSSQ